jgi:imidazole glycerol-phosphate synthase subunit HisF
MGHTALEELRGDIGVLRPRIIPCLLIRNGGLVKTVNFANPKYVGDPINAVRIFNEKEVDELFVVDIDASTQNHEPNYVLIKNLAAECRMPLCYGGGVKTVEQIQRIINLGVEKVAVSSAAVDNPMLLSEACNRVGRQSIVFVMDVKKSAREYEVYTHNGIRATKLNPVDFVKRVEPFTGEVVINSIDRDGAMKGYDMELVKQVRDAISVPLTVLGGAGSLTDIVDLTRTFGIIGAAAGSLFVFKGAYRAVLINYPSRADKDALILQPIK